MKTVTTQMHNDAQCEIPQLSMTPKEAEGQQYGSSNGSRYQDT